MSALLLGGTYIEIDGLLYPNLVMEGEDVNAFSGKFGDLWKHYMEEKTNGFSKTNRINKTNKPSRTNKSNNKQKCYRNN